MPSVLQQHFLSILQKTFKSGQKNVQAMKKKEHLMNSHIKVLFTAGATAKKNSLLKIEYDKRYHLHTQNPIFSRQNDANTLIFPCF